MAGPRDLAESNQIPIDDDFSYNMFDQLNQSRMMKILHGPIRKEHSLSGHARLNSQICKNTLPFQNDRGIQKVAP